MIIFVRPSKNASRVLQRYFCIIFQKEQRVSYLNKEKREGEGERERAAVYSACFRSGFHYFSFLVRIYITRKP